MGSRAVGKRPRQLRMLPLIAASLVMVLASVPALASQATDLVPENPATPPVQDDPAPEPAGAAPGCDHAAGEFLVGYTSEEALQAASPENVVETLDGILAQHLAFEEIKNIPDQAERLAAEEAKGQELGARPGVAYAEYNCVATAQAASAERAADLPTPASCGDCGSYVVDRAKEVIADGFGDAEGRDAFDAALEATRSTGTDDENVAFASEVELDDEASADGSSDSDSDGSSADEDDGADGSASDDAVSEGSGAGGARGKAADDDESGTEEEADDEEASSGDTEDETEEEDSAGNGPMPVAGKNAAATTSEPRKAGGTGGK